MIKNKYFSLVFFILICYFAAYIGSMATFSSVDNWYTTINKPTFNPPNWIFAPTWTTLYTLMGISMWLIYLEKDKINIRSQTFYFFTQLFCNCIWSYLFFYLKNPLYGLIDIIFLWILILLTIISFWKVNKKAAILLIPYILWVGFAGFLNYTIWKIN